MVVQHNIMALNAYNKLSTNNSAVTKNLEKLSSGYKINRAGDDAAGLAISEKMRAQITGLERASDNAQDGISLVQTAEGALTEVHSMLNRMVELSTQSANGTYDNETDRANLQKEVESLQSEIDRIADETNFNGTKLLNGSLQDTDAVDIKTNAKVDGASFTQTASVTAVNRENIAASKYHTELAAYDVTNTNTTTDRTISVNYADANGDAKKVTLTIGAGQTASLSDIATALSTGAGDGTIITYAQATDDDGTDLAASTDGGQFADLFAVSVGTDGNSLVFTAKDTTATQPLLDGREANLSITSITLDHADLDPDQGTNVASYSEVITEVAGAAEQDTQATLGSVTYTLTDGANIASGSTLKIGSKTVEFLKDGATATGSNIGIDVTGKTAADIAKLINDNAGIINGATGYNVSYVNDKLKISNTVGAGQASEDATASKSMEAGGDLDVTKAVTFTAAVKTAASTDLTFDAEKLTDKTTVTIGSNSYLLTSDEKYTDGATTEDGKTVVKYAADDTAAQIAGKFKTAVGSGATVDGAKVTVAGTDAVTVKSAGLTLQIGDTDTQRISVEINDMDSKSLGVDVSKVDISSEKGATAAIDIVKKAINTVSATRADLGAIQNRLEYTVNNLATTTENLTSAESRIRDTDMAKEMMAYTKNNVLSQAAQAMLAQANQQPQQVLQLLQ